MYDRKHINHTTASAPTKGKKAQVAGAPSNDHFPIAGAPRTASLIDKLLKNPLSKEFQDFTNSCIEAAIEHKITVAKLIRFIIQSEEQRQTEKDQELKKYFAKIKAEEKSYREFQEHNKQLERAAAFANQPMVDPKTLALTAIAVRLDEIREMTSELNAVKSENSKQAKEWQEKQVGFAKSVREKLLKGEVELPNGEKVALSISLEDAIAIENSLAKKKSPMQTIQHQRLQHVAETIAEVEKVQYEKIQEEHVRNGTQPDEVKDLAQARKEAFTITKRVDFAVALEMMELVGKIKADQVFMNNLSKLHPQMRPFQLINHLVLPYFIDGKKRHEEIETRNNADIDGAVVEKILTDKLNSVKEITVASLVGSLLENNSELRQAFLSLKSACEPEDPNAKYIKSFNPSAGSSI